MYTLLICDDEYYIRESLASRVRGFGFPAISKVLTAYDVESALSAAKENPPNIVITDIRMEKDNGFDLIKNLKKIFDNVQYVIISGYEDFQYAKNAIEMEVTGYLLKPVIDEELRNVIEKCLNKLLQSREAMRMLQSVQSYEKKNFNMQRENEIKSFLQNGASEPEKFIREYFGWKAGEYTCAMFYIEPKSFSTSSFLLGEERLLKFGIKNIAEELTEQYGLLHYLFIMTYGMNCLPMIICREDGEKEPEIDEFLKEMTRQLKICFDVKIYLSVSGIHEEMNVNLLTEAMFAVKYRFFNHENESSIQHFRISQIDSVVLTEKKELLRKVVKQRNDEGIRNAVSDILCGTENASVSFEKICSIISVIMETTSAQKTFLQFLEGMINVDADVFDDKEQVQEYFTEILVGLCVDSSMDYVAQQEDRETIQKIEDYVNQNYMKKISVQKLAKLFFIEPSYLSTLFKRHTGVTFTNYIRKLRIEKACVLLRETHMKTSDIARHVGFDDLLYFYKVFKKIKGVTTTQYREEYEKGTESHSEG